MKKSIQLLFSGILLGYQIVKAQPFVEQTDAEFLELSNYYRDAAWGDYDNDGDLDLVICGKNASENPVTKLYQNNLSSNSGFSETDINLEGIHGGLSWGDYNNDGFLDLILSGYNTANTPVTVIYENNGDETFTQLPVDGASGKYGFEINVEWIDFNNDGWLDFVQTGVQSEVYVNDGNGSFETSLTINEDDIFDLLTLGDFNNDGFTDAFTTAADPSTSRIFSNNGDDSVTEIEHSIADIQHGRSAACDYDNDGDLDLFVTGFNGSFQSILYKNGGDFNFEEQPTSFKGVQDSYVSWGDLNNDGLSDLCYSGLQDQQNTVYQNNGDNTFSGLLNTDGPFHLADYDNDGDLDILAQGNRLFKNETTANNSAPTAPTNLKQTVNDDHVILSWEAASDDFTPSEALTYNVRMGSTPKGIDILSPNSGDDGYRLIPQMGNAELDTFYILNRIPDGDFYWSVQAIDNGYMAGLFTGDEPTVEEPLSTDPSDITLFKMYPNPSHHYLNIEGQIQKDRLHHFTIFNIHGSLIKNGKFSSQSKSIDVADLNEGMYFIKIQQSNQQPVTLKFSKVDL